MLLESVVGDPTIYQEQEVAPRSHEVVCDSGLHLSLYSSILWYPLCRAVREVQPLQVGATTPQHKMQEASYFLDGKPLDGTLTVQRRTIKFTSDVNV